mmetsp:Transcript_19502/g.29610  ORF Transcript_19502/g.29610 Transcript_19502/m.29610 type:complete len:94 (+) Transcript_19502:122-403(+)
MDKVTLVTIHIVSKDDEAGARKSVDSVAFIDKNVKLSWPESQRDKQLTMSLVAIVSYNDKDDAIKGTESESTDKLSWVEYNRTNQQTYCWRRQ